MKCAALIFSLSICGFGLIPSCTNVSKTESDDPVSHNMNSEELVAFLKSDELAEHDLRVDRIIRPLGRESTNAIICGIEANAQILKIGTFTQQGRDREYKYLKIMLSLKGAYAPMSINSSTYIPYSEPCDNAAEKARAFSKSLGIVGTDHISIVDGQIMKDLIAAGKQNNDN